MFIIKKHTTSTMFITVYLACNLYLHYKKSLNNNQF